MCDAPTDIWIEIGFDLPARLNQRPASFRFKSSTLRALFCGRTTDSPRPL